MSLLHYYFPPTQPPEHRRVEVDLCCYGSSPAAITAAVQARRLGRSVALVIPAERLGGLTAGGLGNTDIGNRAAIGGLAREVYRRVGEAYGVEEEWRFEPKVAEAVFAELLREEGIVPLRREFVNRVERQGMRIREVGFESGLVVQARYYLDGSYEGDLMALAGVSHEIGRESNQRYGETLNGVQCGPYHQFEVPVDPYRREGDPASGLLPGIHSEPLAPTGSGDAKIQAYNFRLCLTQAEDRIPFTAPEGYDPLNYELLARQIRAGIDFDRVFRKFDLIRNGKTDTNNWGAVSTDYIGGNWAFPEATYAERERIFQDHVRWHQGLFWFYCSDPRVPAELAARMRSWGLARDEFVTTGGWPHQLYIRESRRMVSDYVITEHDCRGERRVDDGVALGAYGMDSHHCQRVVVDGRVRNEGDVQVVGFPPYPISYRAIVPRRGEVENLFVPVCCSASHIAYGSVRMEPVFMILGQSAAFAADLGMRDRDGAVQDIPYAALRQLMEDCGQIVAWNPDPATADPAAYEPEAPAPVASLRSVS